MIDGEMAGKTEFCGGRRDLPLAVRLHDAAGDDRIGAAGNGFVQHVVELAQLVAAEAEPGGVLAFDPQPRSAEMRGQPLHRFERGGQGGEAEAGKGGEPIGESHRFFHPPRCPGAPPLERGEGPNSGPDWRESVGWKILVPRGEFGLARFGAVRAVGQGLRAVHFVEVGFVDFGDAAGTTLRWPLTPPGEGEEAPRLDLRAAARLSSSSR